MFCFLSICLIIKAIPPAPEIHTAHSVAKKYDHKEKCSNKDSKKGCGY